MRRLTTLLLVGVTLAAGAAMTANDVMKTILALDEAEFVALRMALAEDETIPLTVKWSVEGRGEGFETLETVEAEVVVQIVTDHQRPLDPALPDHQRRIKQRIGA